MNGIQFVTDEKGRKVAVQLDLKKHRGSGKILKIFLSPGRGVTKSGFPWKRSRRPSLKAASSPGELPGFADRKRGKRIERAAR